MLLLAVLALPVCWCSAPAVAAAPYAGRPLAEVLQELAARGLKLVYSSEAVPGDLRVMREPSGGTPAEVLGEVLAPHGLRAKRVGADTYAIVPAKPRSGAEATRPAGSPEEARVDEVIVTASRYALSADVPDVHTFLTRSEIEGLPRLAEDPLKAVHRLPGAASNGLSGLANIRGGESNETLIVFDGLPLYEPFHLRLLLSPSSLLDPRTLSGLDVHAGGFTAEFGDRMSAVIEAESLRPEADRYYELGLSLFHANALASHRFAGGDGQWLASFRRSNLDEVADLAESAPGEPSYVDGFVRVDYAFSDATRGSLHALLASDQVELHNSAEIEFAKARYRNSYVWATLEHDFSHGLSTSAVASYTDVASDRSGEVLDPGHRTGTVDDERHYDVFGLKLDAAWSSDRWLHRFGLEYREQSAEYQYFSALGFEAGYPFPQSEATEFTRSLEPEPSGEHVAVYATSRLRLTENLTAELGLRWDHQGYGMQNDDRFAPRLNLSYAPAPATRLRASWGRFRQSQGINELQVEDGVDEFHPAQLADHSILGIEQDLARDFTLRVEGYRKEYRDLRPRYESLFDPLSLVPELRWDRTRIAPESARAEGVEWLLTRKGLAAVNGWLSYAWSRVRDLEDGTRTARSWDQAHAVGGGLSWSDHPWQATIAGSYHTGWPTTPLSVVDAAAPDASIAVGARNSRRFADFASVDMRVSRSFDLSRGELSLFAEVSNLLDRRNPCCVDYTYDYDTGGNLLLEREYRHWLPLVPSVGVLWRY